MLLLFDQSVSSLFPQSAHCHPGLFPDGREIFFLSSYFPLSFGVWKLIFSRNTSCHPRLTESYPSSTHFLPLCKNSTFFFSFAVIFYFYSHCFSHRCILFWGRHKGSMLWISHSMLMVMKMIWDFVLIKLMHFFKVNPNKSAKKP